MDNWIIVVVCLSLSLMAFGCGVYCGNMVGAYREFYRMVNWCRTRINDGMLWDDQAVWLYDYYDDDFRPRYPNCRSPHH